MSIQMALLGSQSQSRITAQTSVVSDISVGSGSVTIGLLNNGNQIEVRNGNTSAIGQWVTPTTSVDEWEVRAVLDSGDTPTGTLGSWLNFSVNREWGFVLDGPGNLACSLTFEFRKVGGSSAEETIAGNSLTLEVLDTF